MLLWHYLYIYYFLSFYIFNICKISNMHIIQIHYKNVPLKKCVILKEKHERKSFIELSVFFLSSIHLCSVITFEALTQNCFSVLSTLRYFSVSFPGLFIFQRINFSLHQYQHFITASSKNWIIIFPIKILLSEMFNIISFLN